ncbi:hypothetical protein E2C01_050076 [Portunus trituberculatus]|uniref:Uncharacterized protein n=1 Tax=Portunus trituberculatus TaxID=210409 RepID=A0A5B7GFJ5_PORTR|nr:hypothetical protein [Portunus trituberculatus]
MGAGIISNADLGMVSVIGSGVSCTVPLTLLGLVLVFPNVSALGPSHLQQDNVENNEMYLYHCVMTAVVRSLVDV